MKAYERVSVEVVKFEAQDVITASVAAPVECICTNAEGEDVCDDTEMHRVYSGNSFEVCPAERHNCTIIA